MIIGKKKRNLLLLAFLFAILLSVSALAEIAYFNWYDANGALCKTTDAGAVLEYYQLTTDTDPAPTSHLRCCDIEGQVTVKYYTDYGRITEPEDAYKVNWDTKERDCTCYYKIWMVGKLFESKKFSCCGDDTGEFPIVKGIGNKTISLPVACCDNKNDCADKIGRCQDEYGKEVTCWPGDGLDNDCDGKTDCSDTDCATQCGLCVPEICNNLDEDGDPIDDDCDNYANCQDSDCLGDPACTCDQTFCFSSSNTCADPNRCKGCQENCNDKIDNNCDGKKDCADTGCTGVNPPCPNCVKEDCYNGKDDDCDGFIDHLDKDCIPGCPAGQTVCKDGKCCEDCNKCDIGPQGCINKNGKCEEGEGCACDDCDGKQDSCKISFVCDSFYNKCSCTAGTKLCADGSCRKDCSICGNGILEPGEECDGGTKTCNEFDTCTPTGKTVNCVGCKWDTKVCTCLQCDPAKSDDVCCVNDGDGKCDPDCTEENDPDCKIIKCTPNPNDCCKPLKDGTCDTDCIPGLDPDCQTCQKTHDDCCSNLADNNCDPDCTEENDPDCIDDCTPNSGDCCKPLKDGTCDTDCIPGLDPDCHCGNLMIDPGETCDRTNLDGKTCSIFEFDSGTLTCFAPDSDQNCTFDTSGCYKEVCINKNGKCEDGEDCRCSDCTGKQATCGYGQVCDNTGSCKCEDGTTLCDDGTCRQTCPELPTCDGDNTCEFGEGCACSGVAGCVSGECNDCKGKTDTCKGSSMCVDGKCTSCSILKAYWTEDCVGKGKEVFMMVEGVEGCKGKSINLKLKEEDAGVESVLVPLGDDDVEIITAVFDSNAKINHKWITKFDEEGNGPNDCILGQCDATTEFDESPPKKFLEYYFVAEVGSEKFESEVLDVHYCIPECDNDCDGYVDGSKVDQCDKNPKNDKIDADESYGIHEGKLMIDANPKSGYCQECDPNGLSPGQETCAAYFDCTPDWWKGLPPSEWTGKITSTEASAGLGWGECGEDKGATGDGRSQVTSELMRGRLVCPPNLQNLKKGEPGYDANLQCCKDQASCYCKVPDTEIMEELGCNDPAFRPTEIKACLAEEKFPFFTNMNILVVVLILTVFYIFYTSKTEQKKTKTKRQSKPVL